MVAGLSGTDRGGTRARIRPHGVDARHETLQRTHVAARQEGRAQVSANLERHQIGEQFKVLDPARLPEKPTAPTACSSTAPVRHSVWPSASCLPASSNSVTRPLRPMETRSRRHVARSGDDSRTRHPESELAAEKKQRRTLTTALASVAALVVVIVGVPASASIRDEQTRNCTSALVLQGLHGVG